MATEIGGLFVNLGMNTAGFEKAAQATGRRMENIGRQFQRVGSSVSGMDRQLNGSAGAFARLGAAAARLRTNLAPVIGAIGGIAAARGISRWATEMANAAESSTNLGAALGIPLDQILELQGIAQLTEGSVEGASAALLRLSRNVADAAEKAGPAREAFAQPHARLVRHHGRRFVRPAKVCVPGDRGADREYIDEVGGPMSPKEGELRDLAAAELRTFAEQVQIRLANNAAGCSCRSFR